jgi:hypothetical protein
MGRYYVVSVNRIWIGVIIALSMIVSVTVRQWSCTPIIGTLLLRECCDRRIWRNKMCLVGIKHWHGEKLANRN